MSVESDSKSAGHARCDKCGHQVPYVPGKMLMLVSHHMVALHPNADRDVNERLLRLPKRK